MLPNLLPALNIWEINTHNDVQNGNKTMAKRTGRKLLWTRGTKFILWCSVTMGITEKSNP
jgi:hypothetical protein